MQNTITGAEGNREKRKSAIIVTLGCKVNQLESASFAAALRSAGIAITSEKEGAEIIILNTCAVTERASAQSRQKLRRLLRNNPAADVYITGCHIEEVRDDILKMEEIKQHGRDKVFLFGNSYKDILPAAVIDRAKKNRVDDRLRERGNWVGNILTAKEICRLPVAKFSGRTRAYLRIQDGCEAFCSYCIVPYTRGPSRSLPPEEVLEQAKILAENHPELVLTGIHLGFYGAELSPQRNLASLLERLLDELPHTRFRISSLEPVEIDDRLLALFSHPNLMPHLHIPLQSGCDKILQAMNRRYTTAEFRAILEKCHQKIAGLAVGIDILAGFPGESREDFREALHFLEGLDFCYLHVFPYSRRPGTPAAEMDNQVAKREKEQRVQRLLALSHQKRDAFYRSHLGSVRSVLFEGKRDNNGLLKGFSDNYLDVRAEGGDYFLRQTARVELQLLQDSTLLGRIT